MNRAEMSNLYRGPPIDASNQVWVHLVKQFHKEKISQKSMDQKQKLPVAAMFVNA